MKKQIIMIGSLLLMTVSNTSSFASSSSIMDHGMSSMYDNSMAGMDHSTTNKSTISQKQNIKINVIKIDAKTDKKLVQVKLTQIKDNKQLNSQNIRSLVIMDDSLGNSNSISSKALDNEGIYEFEWKPTKSGIIKLSAQVKINGKEILIPFEVNVK